MSNEEILERKPLPEGYDLRIVRCDADGDLRTLPPEMQKMFHPKFDGVHEVVLQLFGAGKVESSTPASLSRSVPQSTFYDFYTLIRRKEDFYVLKGLLDRILADENRTYKDIARPVQGLVRILQPES